MYANAKLSPRECPRTRALVIFIFYLHASVYVQKNIYMLCRYVYNDIIFNLL